MRYTVAFSAVLVCAVILSCSQAAKGDLSAADKQEKQEEKKEQKPGEPKAKTKSTREILTQVVRDYKQGLELLSPTAALKQIDSDRFYDYPRFEEELTIFLRSLGELRLFIREVEVEIKENRAIMIVDAEMKFARREEPRRREERIEEITFYFQRTEVGWKITEISPRAFFLP